MIPLSMVEAIELVESRDDKLEFVSQINKFIKLKPNKAAKLREALLKLENMKVKPEHIAKIIDLLPEDASDMHKIFSEVSLDEDEIKKILKLVQEHL